VFTAGDDTRAKETVARLIENAGFDPVDAGPLSNARYLEPLGALNIQLGYALGRGTQIAPIWIQRTAA
jgi:predicted dinucleotide-binding enzyme